MIEKNNMKLFLGMGIFLILLGGTIIILEKHRQENIKLNGVELSQSDYQAIKEVFGDDYASVRVCNINTGNCIGFLNVEDYMNTFNK